MTDDLLLCLIKRSLDLSRATTPPLAENDDMALAAALAAAGPERVATFLQAVRVAWREEKQRLERLNRALQRKTTELRRTECLLEKPVADERLLLKAIESARTAPDLGQIIGACLEAVCDLSGWPAAYAWIPPAPNPTGFLSAGPDPRGRWVVREERLQELFPDAAGVVQRFRRAWEAGDGCGDEMRAAGFRVGLVLPISVQGQMVAVIEAFSCHPAPIDRRTLSLIHSMGQRLGEILERRWTEKEQAVQFGLLNAALDLSPDGILVVNAARGMIVANSRFASLWRIPAAVMASRSDEKIMDAMRPQLADPDGFLRRARELYESSELEGTDELELADGRVFQRWTQPVRVQGRPAGRIWVFQDLTPRRQAERQQTRLEEQLRQCQKMEAIGLLAGGVAHDFNNLLTAIMGYAQMVLGSLDPDDSLRTPVLEICRAGNRAATLTQQLLAFSRRRTVAPRVLDLGEAIDGMAPMLRRLIGEKVELVIQPAGDPGHVRADAGQIEQVIMNLAINARDAMPAGGTLTLRTESAPRATAGSPVAPGPPAERWVVLTITDTGTGMDEATRSRVFEPFFTTKDPGRGTGLGLPTVLGIVTQSGGHLEVDSVPGCGTTFRVYLPGVDPPAGASAPAAPLQGLAGGVETILVVEDEEMVRELARDVLRLAGYTVLTAGGGAEALLIGERHPGPIHLLLCDVIMPQLNGRQTHERLLAIRPDLKVLFMSAHTDDIFTRQEMVDPGAPFIQKPFTLAALTARVREALDQAQAEAA